MSENDRLAAQFLAALLANPSLLPKTPVASVWKQDALELIPVARRLAGAFLATAGHAPPPEG